MARSLESTSLYSQHGIQLEDHIRAKTTNVLEKVYVENVRIKDFYENPDGNDTLVVILSSTLRDYVIEDQSKRVIEGDPQEDLFTVYQMNFIRKHGSQTELNVSDEAISDHCPNCGAPLKISAISKCDYCDADLTRSPNQWVLDTYDVVDEDELYNWEEIMGFIRAALSSGLNSFNDSKFKEAIVLPNNLTADALAIKGQLLKRS